MNKTILGILMWGAILSTACTDTEQVDNLYSSEEVVHFTGDIAVNSFTLNRPVATESATYTFEEGAGIGIYAYRGVEPGISSWERNGENHPYKYEGGNFVDQAVTPLYWPTKGGLWFIAYSPYRADFFSVSTPFALIHQVNDVVSQKNRMATDVLNASVQRENGSHFPVHLIFNHSMAKLNIVLQGAFGMQFATQPTVMVKGLKTTAEIRISVTGSIIENLDDVADIIPYRAEAATVRRDSVSMLVIPQTLVVNSGDEFIHIVNQLDGQQPDTYSYRLRTADYTSPILTDGKLLFEAGKEYTLTLTLKNKEAAITNASVSIVAWTSPEAPVLGSGDAAWPEIDD